jgi:hypothetical protein
VGVEDDAGELAFEAADRFAATLAFRLLALEVAAGGWVDAGLCDRDPFVDSDRWPKPRAAHVLDRRSPRRRRPHSCRPDQLAAWLVDYGFARPNGSFDTFELTAYGLEVARETDQLSFWIRADAFKI